MQLNAQKYEENFKPHILTFLLSDTLAMLCHIVWGISIYVDC